MMSLRIVEMMKRREIMTVKKAGVDTEMVRFPGEPHGLSRAGRRVGGRQRRLRRSRDRLHLGPRDPLHS